MKNHYSNRSWSSVTNSSAFWCVLSKITGGATPAARASFQRKAHRHHLSPCLSPLNLYSGRGVIKSLPCLRVKSKNSWVMRAQTIWLPWSWLSVLQQPSLKYPVSGSYEQGTNSVPSTLRACLFMVMYFLDHKFHQTLWSFLNQIEYVFKILLVTIVGIRNHSGFGCF